MLRFFRRLSTMATPIEDALRQKITTALAPTKLVIHNDSHLHAHHKAMVGNTSRETHFRLEVTSAKFEGLRLPARHRLVYDLMKEEMQREGGLHALQMKTRTEEEDGREEERNKV
ncbi:bola domain-containing protein [Tirmania nivea]|nr:bola domain-containing protein [Tirmania nivea]